MAFVGVMLGGVGLWLLRPQGTARRVLYAGLGLAADRIPGDGCLGRRPVLPWAAPS